MKIGAVHQDFSSFQTHTCIKCKDDFVKSFDSTAISYNSGKYFILFSRNDSNIPKQDIEFSAVILFIALTAKRALYSINVQAG